MAGRRRTPAPPCCSAGPSLLRRRFAPQNLVWVLKYFERCHSVGHVGYLVSQLLDTLLDEGLHRTTMRMEYDHKPSGTVGESNATDRNHIGGFAVENGAGAMGKMGEGSERIAAREGGLAEVLWVSSCNASRIDGAFSCNGPTGKRLRASLLRQVRFCLARGYYRRTEFAVRIALGVGRPRLLLQILTENLLIVGAGAIVGNGSRVRIRGRDPKLQAALVDWRRDRPVLLRHGVGPD
jgi:hypothetical protein